MKILHVDTELSWRGGQQQAFYLYQGLLRKGVATRFVAPPSSQMSKRLKEKNLPVHNLAFWGEWDFFHGIALALLARKEGYNILHLHSGHALSWGLWAKLFKPSLRIIAVRRVDFSIRKNFFSRWKYSTSLVDKIVAISDNIRQVLVQDQIPEDKITLIHSGIDLTKFADLKVPEDFRQKWQIPSDAILIGTIAAFAGHKDYPTFLKAASLVIKQHPNACFMAVGEGKLLPDMRELTKTLGIENRMIFTGFQHQVGIFLKSFDIFVISSKKEGLGTTVLDAQATGLPVIGTAAGGIPEMIENETNGLLVEPQDPEKLASAISRLIEEPELRTTLGQKGIETVRKFSIERTVEKNLALYEELTGGRN